MMFKIKRYDFKRILMKAVSTVLVFWGLGGLYSFFFLATANPTQLFVDEFDSSSTPLDWKAIRQLEIDYWKTIQVETMTSKQILDYFRWSNHSACDLIHYFGGVIYFWNPTGIDGQYPVCMDSSVRLIGEPQAESDSTVKPCLVYSIGIRDDWSFDETMERFGCQIFSFDPSLKKPNHNHSKHIHFYNIGLGSEDTVDGDGWKLKTLDSIYQMLVPVHGERVIDYLKIDIEWEEWEVMKQIIDSGMLSKVRQLGIELHLPNKDGSVSYDRYLTIKHYRSLVKLVKSIEERMIRFSSRGIPWGAREIKGLDNFFGNVCFEIAFYQILPYFKS